MSTDRSPNVDRLAAIIGRMGIAPQHDSWCRAMANGLAAQGVWAPIAATDEPPSADILTAWDVVRRLTVERGLYVEVHEFSDSHGVIIRKRGGEMMTDGTVFGDSVAHAIHLAARSIEPLPQ